MNAAVIKTWARNRNRGAGAPVLGPDEVLIRVLARAARRCLMGSPGGLRKDLRDMLAFAAEHGIRPRINRVPLEHLSITLDEINKGHMSGRRVVVME